MIIIILPQGSALNLKTRKKFQVFFGEGGERDCMDWKPTTHVGLGQSGIWTQVYRGERQRKYRQANLIYANTWCHLHSIFVLYIT